MVRYSFVLYSRHCVLVRLSQVYSVYIHIESYFFTINSFMHRYVYFCKIIHDYSIFFVVIMCRVCEESQDSQEDGG